MKLFLNSIGYLILLSNQKANLENGVIEHRKEVAIGDKEIPMSACSFDVADMAYAKRGKPSSDMPELGFDDTRDKRPVGKKSTGKQLTRSQIIQQIRKDCGTNEFHFVSVDTDNCFNLNHVTYRIDSAVTQYSPKQVKDDLLYDMDKIVCVEDKHGGFRFYDQDFSLIDSSLIHMV